MQESFGQLRQVCQHLQAIRSAFFKWRLTWAFTIGLLAAWGLLAITPFVVAVPADLAQSESESPEEEPAGGDVISNAIVTERRVQEPRWAPDGRAGSSSESSDAGPPKLKDIVSDTSAQSLDLRAAENDAQLQDFDGHTKVTWAKIGADVSDEAIERFLRVHPTITSLYLERRKLWPECIAAIANQGRNLERLKIATRLGPNGLHPPGLTPLKAIPRLKEIVFHGGLLTDAEFDELTELPALAVVYVNDSSLQSLQSELSLRKRPGIYRFNSSHFDRSPIGKPLSPEKAREVIFLRGGVVSSDGKVVTFDFECADLLDRVRDLGCEELRLYRTVMTRRALANIAQLTRVRRVKLIESLESDPRGLINLIPLDSLEELTLSGSRYTDDVVPFLVRLGQLRVVELRDTKLSAAGIDRLRNSMPQTKVLSK